MLSADVVAYGDAQARQ